MSRHGNIGSRPSDGPGAHGVHGRGFFRLPRTLGKGTHHGFITDNESTQKVDRKEYGYPCISVHGMGSAIVDHNQGRDVETRD